MQQPIFDNKAPAPNEIGDPTKLSSMIELKIVHRPVAELRPNNHNARSHSKKQIKAIAASIRRLGFNNPVLIDRHGMIIAGHGRCEAAKLIGLAEVPTIRLDHLGPDEIRAYVLADNQLAALAGWDPQILAIELQHLVEVDFDVDITGFEAPEVDKLIEAQLTGPGDSRADDVPDISTDEPPTSRPGDVWLLGQHRLTCGDALNPAYYKALMGTKRARQLFSDPPYNVRIDGNVCGTGSIKHREFAMASGEMSRDEFAKFLKTALSNAAQFSIDGAVHYVCIDWRHVDLLLHTGRDVYSELLNVCVWSKTNAGLGSFYRSQYELVAVFKHGSAPHQNNIQLGRFGRNRSNVWTYAGVNTFKIGRMEELSLHPTVKPVALVADAIRDASKQGDVILDPFCGSGTTIIAAEETSRIAYGLELDPVYVDVAVRRWETLTGGTARLASNGLGFAEMTAMRNSAIPLLPPPSTKLSNGEV